MARGGRKSHLEAASAEAGMAMYLETCGTSGLANVKRAAQRYLNMRGNGRVQLPPVNGQRKGRTVSGKALDTFIAEHGEDAMWGDGEPENDALGNEGNDLEGRIAELQAQLDELQGGGAAQVATRTRSRSKSKVQAEGFVPGASFTYENKAGEVTEHQIERVAGGRVYTDQNQRFKLATLEGLQGDVVNLI